MPVTRFLQSWRVALLVGSWLAFAGVALLLAVADPAQDLHHPSVVLTARCAVGAWFGACAVMLRHGKQQILTIDEAVTDRGQADAINKGFLESTGDILAWQNSDDIYLPNAFLSAAKVFRNSED